MRTIMLVFGLLLIGLAQVGLPTEALAQVGSSISADGSPPNDNAMLDVKSPMSGAGKGILIPRVSENQRTNANGSVVGGLLDDSGNLRGGAAQGLMIYQTNVAEGLYFNASQTATPSWVYLGTSTTNYLPLTGGTMSGTLNMGAQIVSNVASIDFNGTDVSVGRGANGSSSGAAIGYQANGASNGAALGRQANGTNYGAAVGYLANGSGSGAAVGYLAIGTNYGAALGRQANGSDSGAAVGYYANGYLSSAVLGSSANGYFGGAAVGYYAKGTNYGAAVGLSANGANYGAALGRSANGVNSNVAIGAFANAKNGTNHIAIGNNVTNNLGNDTAVIRGTLYLDGGSGIYTNTGFGSSSWTLKAFEIDHPLDPENKILRHFCLEGPQVWNVYAGNAQLVNGQAVIELPEYYSALNLVGSEIYSLTVVDESTDEFPLVKVVKKVADNGFVIAGTQDVKVSWTIKVLRNDPGCIEDLKRRPVEQWKNEIGN